MSKEFESKEEKIQNLALKYFDQAGFAAAITPSTINQYVAWLNDGFAGEMGYLARHLEKKTSPEKLLLGAQSWISLTLCYDTEEPLSIDQKENFEHGQTGWVSRYARGGDYHDEIAKRLDSLVGELQALWPEEKFWSAVDSKPVLERDVAARAGLGWIGKNTCLIDQKRGSFMFLAEILTTLKLESGLPVADHCGTCNRCIEACPTQALIEPYRLDARKCISYWTIENDKLPPPEVSKNFGFNLFGCDICQDVCPWNKKARRLNTLPPAISSGAIKLKTIIDPSESDIEIQIKGQALERAGAKHLKQNASLVYSLQNKRNES